MAVLSIIAIVVVLVLILTSVSKFLRGREVGNVSEGQQPDINWKLIFALSLLITLFCSLIGFIAELIEQSYEIPLGFLFLCALVIPAWVIAKKVRLDRFLHGVITGLIGWTLGIIVMGFLLIVTQPYLLPHAPADWGEGVGIGAFMVWVLGMITSPVLGFLASLLGRKTGT